MVGEFLIHRGFNGRGYDIGQNLRDEEQPVEHKPKPGWKPWKPPPEKQDRSEQQPKSRWRPALRGALRVFAALIAVGALLFVFRGYYPENLRDRPLAVLGAATVVVAAIVVLIRIGQRYEWTGFGESAHPKPDTQGIQPRKTLWDWLQLLIVPLALALIVVVWSTAQEDVRLQELENQRAEAQRQLVEQQAQDEALQAYLDVMKELLLEQNLRDSGPASNARAVANVQTSLMLERVDARRKTAVLHLLTDSHLIDADAPLIETSTLALQGADARGMDLSDTDLSDTDLSDTDLSHANLEDAMMEGANLFRANLSPAFLSGANLKEANLILANLSGADLRVADLSDANLRLTDLSNADLSGADLSEANLHDARLSGADLKDANLSGADLWRASLSDANLSDANLSGAYLIDANLSGANMGGATGVTEEQLEERAKSLEGATMPNGQKYEDWLKRNE